MPANLPKRCRETDQATAGLITDLKQRGLLEDTIVVWGGEFGRKTFSQSGQVNESYGRDHHAPEVQVGNFDYLMEEIGWEKNWSKLEGLQASARYFFISFKAALAMQETPVSSVFSKSG